MSAYVTSVVKRLSTVQQAALAIREDGRPTVVTC